MKVCEDYVINSMGFKGVTYMLIKVYQVES